MRYEEVYSRFLTNKMTDANFFKMTQDEAYQLMNSWLHDIASQPHIRKCFSSISFDDEIQEFTYELVDSRGDDSDKDFVIEIFSQGMAICWLRPKVDSALNVATVIGGKEEKTLQMNYKTNIERLNSLELKLKKHIRNHGYYNISE